MKEKILPKGGTAPAKPAASADPFPKAARVWVADTDSFAILEGYIDVVPESHIFRSVPEAVEFQARRLNAKNC